MSYTSPYNSDYKETVELKNEIAAQNLILIATSPLADQLPNETKIKLLEFIKFYVEEGIKEHTNYCNQQERRKK